MHESFPPKTPGCVRLALVGDVVGKPGMRIACSSVSYLRSIALIDGLIVNGENAADGTGLRLSEYRKLVEAGYNAITLGDHIYKKREIIEALQANTNISKPANFPPTAPGKEWSEFQLPSGQRIAVVSLLGRVFMRPVDCPFLAIDRVLAAINPEIKIVLIDVHAEATSDKQTLARYLDGRVSAILGTHTHVTTADEQILQRGTGFQCDVGMTGPYLSILGRQIDPVVQTNLSFDPNSFHVATEDVRLAATWVDIDSESGACKAIGRIQLREGEQG